MVATFLPLSHSPIWWVRGLDFPRAQLLAAALALLVWDLLAGDLSQVPWLVLAGLAALCTVWHAAWILPWTPLHTKEVPWARDGERLRIVSANVLISNRQSDRLLAIVRAEEPHVLCLLETDHWWEARMDEALAEDYPHAVRYPLDNSYGMHVYSRLPMHATELLFRISEDVPSARFDLELPSGRRVRFHCVHPEPPSPTENEESTDRDAELVLVGREVVDEPGPVVVAGDLNDVAWSHSTRVFRAISKLLDPRVGRGCYNTFHAKLPLLRWPLDHLFHSAHFTCARLQVLGPFGSDHFPILVELALEPGRAERSEAPDLDSGDREWAEDTVQAARAARPLDADVVPRPG